MSSELDSLPKSEAEWSKWEEDRRREFLALGLAEDAIMRQIEATRRELEDIALEREAENLRAACVDLQMVKFELCLGTTYKKFLDWFAEEYPYIRLKYKPGNLIELQFENWIAHKAEMSVTPIDGGIEVAGWYSFYGSGDWCMVFEERCKNYFGAITTADVGAGQDVLPSKPENPQAGQGNSIEGALSALLPKDERTKKKFKKAWKIYQDMCKEYEAEVLDGQSNTRKPTIQDFRTRVISEMKWQVGERRLSTVIKLGEAELLKR